VFQGTFRVRVDPKGRLAIPIAFRRQIPDGSYVSAGPDEVLTIYPPDQWEEISRELATPLVGGTSEQRQRARAFYSFAEPCQFDQQGRVTLSPAQRRLAQIEPHSTVAVIGNNQVVEIWSEARWDSYSADALGRFTELLSR
jgi:MraZ protein